MLGKLEVEIDDEGWLTFSRGPYVKNLFISETEVAETIGVLVSWLTRRYAVAAVVAENVLAAQTPADVKLPGVGRYRAVTLYRANGEERAAIEAAGWPLDDDEPFRCFVLEDRDVDGLKDGR